jgi:heme-degrading monooxygenase HmoA
MYAHLVIFTLGPGMRSTAEKLADQLAPVYRTVKGFKSITFLGDDKAGEDGSLSLWESKEDVEAFRKVAGPS